MKRKFNKKQYNKLKLMILSGFKNSKIKEEFKKEGINVSNMDISRINKGLYYKDID